MTNVSKDEIPVGKLGIYICICICTFMEVPLLWRVCFGWKQLHILHRTCLASHLIRQDQTSLPGEKCGHLAIKSQWNTETKPFWMTGTGKHFSQSIYLRPELNHGGIVKALLSAPHHRLSTCAIATQTLAQCCAIFLLSSWAKNYPDPFSSKVIIYFQPP